MKRRFLFPITSSRLNRPVSIGQIINGETDDDGRKTRLKQALVNLYSRGALTDAQLAEAIAEHGLKHA